MTEQSHCPAFRLVATVAAIVLGTTAVACGNSRDSASGTGTPSANTTVADTVELNFSGGVNGKVSTFVGVPECRWYRNGETDSTYSYEFASFVSVNGRKFSLTAYQSSARPDQRTYPIIGMVNSKTSSDWTDVSLSHMGQTLTDDRWSTGLVVNDREVTGTLTINDDQSASIDATLSRVRQAKGGPVTIKGTWSCSKILGRK